MYGNNGHLNSKIRHLPITKPHEGSYETVIPPVLLRPTNTLS